MTAPLEFDEADVKRFLSFVDKLPNGCHFWNGARSRGKNRSKKWYGSFSLRGKTVRAHRFACEAIGGMRALEPGEHRDHTCQFSLCVNFEHLEITTHKENNDRKVERRRKVNAALGILAVILETEDD